MSGTFQYLNHNQLTPPGSVMAYMGTTDQNGWVIMNGTTRSVSDSRFINLYNTFGASSAIGTVSSDGNTFTPINLQAAFLRGTGKNSLFDNYAGPNLGSQQSHATHSHAHNVYLAENDHSHSIATTYYYNINNEGGAAEQDTYGGGDGDGNFTNGVTMNANSSGITMSLSNSTTKADSTETCPVNFGVNWIIKY